MRLQSRAHRRALSPEGQPEATMNANLHDAAVTLACVFVEERYLAEMQRDDDPDRDHRNGALANCLEEAADIVGLNVDDPETFGGLLERVHDFADANYPHPAADEEGE
jgi:hypothetical protein